MVRFDAISLAARDTVRTFAGDSRFEAVHLGHACDFPEVVHHRCGSVAELLLHRAYQEADAAIFHFGIHDGLFNALLAGGPSVRIVRFHNVTPPRFVASRDVPTIKRSLMQIDTLRGADEIWADSPINAKELLTRGFEPARVRVVPLAVEDPRPATLSEKSAEPVRVLFVSRIVPSKGVHDLVSAVARAGLPHGALEVTLAGNTAWSDPAYLERLRHLIRDLDLEEVVRFAGRIDDAERERLFHAAHILAMPSYHEGFCRPVAEGLRAGCIPLVYDAYNLPHIAARLGRATPPGDVAALATALADLVRAVPAALAHPSEPVLPLDRGKTSACDFAALAAEHTAGFGFVAVGRLMRQRLLRLVHESMNRYVVPERHDPSIGSAVEMRARASVMRR
jgi:glycosyltransferase involved in cell wall biosynthesis